MTMTRELLEQYLDDALPTGQAAQVRKCLETDSMARKDLEALRQQRALRQAALHSYAPSAQEAGALSQRWLSEFRAADLAPVARIGHVSIWLRRLTGVAAALVIAACGFWAGHATAPSALVNTVEPTPSSYVVKFVTPDGVIDTRNFDNLQDAQAFANKLAGEQQGERVADRGGRL